MTSILTLLIAIAIVGIFVWFLTTLPMPPVFRNALIAIAAICLLLYVMKMIGLVRLPL